MSAFYERLLREKRIERERGWLPVRKWSVARPSLGRPDDAEQRLMKTSK